LFTLKNKLKDAAISYSTFSLIKKCNWLPQRRSPEGLGVWVEKKAKSHYYYKQCSSRHHRFNF